MVDVQVYMQPISHPILVSMGNDTGYDNDTYRSLLMVLGEKQLQSMASDNVATYFHSKRSTPSNRSPITRTGRVR